MSALLSSHPDTLGSQATLTIDLGALAANWQLLRQQGGAAECGAVIKADAYGIGLEPAARALQTAGCRTFFVAHVSEALRARAVLGSDPSHIVYVLNGLLPEPGLVDLYRAHDLRAVLGSLDDVERWQREGSGLAAAIHVDTGMNRLGLSLEELRQLVANHAAGTLGFPISLLMSHFISSEIADSTLNARQIATFDTARSILPDVPGSLCNSSGLFLSGKPVHDLTRPGYAMFGGNPTPDAPNPMRPVVHLSARILRLREIATGETAGYNAQWTAKRPTRLGVIGVGYADGLPRNAMATDAHSGGEAIVAGVRCPFAGRVSMDLTIIDITDVPLVDVRVGMPVELLGSTISVDDLGQRADTIGYEILTNLGARYHRVYVDDAGSP